MPAASQLDIERRGRNLAEPQLALVPAYEGQSEHRIDVESG